jgi:hypothetical protein
MRTTLHADLMRSSGTIRTVKTRALLLDDQIESSTGSS